MAVDADDGLAGVGQDAQADRFVGGGDHAAVERHVRGDRGEDEGVHVGREDRSAGGEAVGRGAGRGGYGERVGGVGRQQSSGEVDADADLPVAGEFLQDDVVERGDVQRAAPAAALRGLGPDPRRRQGGPRP